MLPPGPRSGLLTILRYMRDPIASTSALFERYGDPHTVHMIGPPTVSTRDPQLIRSIFAQDSDTYLPWGREMFAAVLGEGSLMALIGERHRAVRKILMPPFLGARMKAYGRVMQTITAAELERQPRRQPFPIQQAIQTISLRIILKAVFGITDPAATRHYEQLLLAAIGAVTPPFIFIGALRNELFGFGPWARAKRCERELARLINEEVARRRAEPAEREDVLSLVMAARYDDGQPMTSKQLFDTLLTLMAAGHETSASAAAWAYYLVQKNSRVRDKLRAELATLPDDAEPEAIARLPYLGAVCDETLRLNPAVPNVTRVLTRPLTLGRWELPAGVGLNPSIVGLHYHPGLYPEPMDFRPERHLERSFGPTEYMPFGGGHRRCIGAAFAMYELKIVLATLLRDPSLILVGDKPVRLGLRNIAMGPTRPIMVMFE
jgi:cytochrome P450